MGTDISGQALAIAHEGEYEWKTVQGLKPPHLRRYFAPVGSKPVWRVRPVAKRLVKFRRHNLMQSMNREPFDCVFIRNVLIYFDRESRQVVVGNLINSLASQGYLVVGPAEGIFEMLGALKKHSPFLYQKVA